MCTKKWLPALFIVLLFAATGTRAQITLTAANFTNALAGTTDTILVFSFEPIIMPVLSPATHGLWDMTGNVADTTVGPGMQWHNYFPADSIAFPAAKFSIDDENGFYITNYLQENLVTTQRAFTSAAYEEYGEHLTTQMWPVNLPPSTDNITVNDQYVTHSAPRMLLKFPATYNSTWSCTYHDSISMSLNISGLYDNTPAYTIRYITETNTVVGWGRMKVRKPDGHGGNYTDVLQVKRKLTEVDSTFVNGSATSVFLTVAFYGFTQGGKRTEYIQDFYLPGRGIPLATVGYSDSTFSTPLYESTLSWSEYTDPETVPATTKASNINLYPNPVTGNAVTLDIPDATGNWAYQLVNMVGMHVAAGTVTASNNHVSTQIKLPASLTPGMYYIRLSNNDKEVAVKALDIVK